MTLVMLLLLSDDAVDGLRNLFRVLNAHVTS